MALSETSIDGAPDLPEVSILSSWTVAPPCPFVDSCLPVEPLGLTLALHEGIGLFDLYFLNHREIAWYAEGILSPSAVCDEPHAFAAQLTIREIENIAIKLRKLMTQRYDGRLVGPRPRFVACATFFPLISSDNEDQRVLAVRAVQNTLYLAANLGIKCVEIVGGAGVPGLDNPNIVVPADYRSERMRTLAQSIHEIYDFSDPVGFDDIRFQLYSLRAKRTLPYIALEIEPGPTFLINKLDEFVTLRGLIETRGKKALASEYFCLNVDVAHAFLTGYGACDIGPELKHAIAHIHLSDHGGDLANGGMHAADLRPGKYHFFDSAPMDGDREKLEYRRWLDLAIELNRNKKEYYRYSGGIGIELEACHDVNEAIMAVNITRQWLKRCSAEQDGGTATVSPQSPSGPAGSDPDVATSTRPSGKPIKAPSAPPGGDPAGSPASAGLVAQPAGALLTIDLGNSTVKYADDAPGLDAIITELCRAVLDQGGSVMSYTGDGFIALFEDRHFRDMQTVAKTALDAATNVCDMISSAALGTDVTIRAALHWGDVHIPTSGPLRDQVMGAAVICATRLCDFIGETLEAATPVRLRNKLIATTLEFIEILIPSQLHTPVPEQPRIFDDVLGEHGMLWKYWGPYEFKGLGKKTHVYYLDHAHR